MVCATCGEEGHHAVWHELPTRACECGCGRNVPFGSSPQRRFHPICAEARRVESARRATAVYNRKRKTA